MTVVSIIDTKDEIKANVMRQPMEISKDDFTYLSFFIILQS